MSLSLRPRLCPRCRSSRTKRHGRSHGVQRFFCHTCRRAFNERTGMPAARSRRLAAWHRFRRDFDPHRPLRADARRLGVSLATAWRWRHRCLASLRGRAEAAPPSLAGDVACDILALHTYTGYWSSPPYQPGGPPVGALISLVEVLPPPSIGPAPAAREQVHFAFDFTATQRRLDPILARYISPGSTADTVRGRAHIPPRQRRDHGGGAEEPGVRWAPLRRPKRSSVPAAALRGRFIRWMKRFRGVRLAYLDRYIAAFHAVQAPAALPGAA
ncbi:MAG TPA: hypothetical protein VF234_05980 [Limnochordia bacterium]